MKKYMSKMKKKKNVKPSEQFQNKICKSQKEAKSIPPTRKHMTTHPPVLEPGYSLSIFEFMVPISCLYQQNY